MAAERRAQMEALELLDAGLWLGAPAGFPLAAEATPESLRADMTAYGLRGGLVSHWRGVTESAQAGNESVAQAQIAWDEHLHAVWTGLPTGPGQNGPLPGQDTVPPYVRAVRVFPHSHNFVAVDWCLGGLCRWLTQRAMPLLVRHTEIDWPDLYQLARTFAELPIILESQTRKLLYHTRTLFALLHECPNVHVELSNFAAQGLLEHAVAQVGPERLIFGSFWPVNDPLVPIGLILDADLPWERKTMIAGGNLRRLLQGVRA
jgi:hypothetical protein